MIKLKKILTEASALHWVSVFKKHNPQIKEVWFIPPPKLLRVLKEWWGNPQWVDMKDDGSHDYSSIKYWKSIPLKKYPPIIVGDNPDGYKIIDGQHRTYAACIVNKNKKIKELIKKNMNVIDDVWE